MRFVFRGGIGETVVGSQLDGRLEGIYTDLAILNCWVYSFAYSCRVLEST